MNKDELTNVVAKAMIARNAVRAYKKKNGVSPKVKIKEVLEFQQVEPSLTKDSFWGPNSVAAATYYLSKSSDTEVPPSHPAYNKVAVTWKPPVIDIAKQAAVEGPPPAPPEPKKVETAKPKEKTKTKAKATSSGNMFGDSISKLKKSARAIADTVKDTNTKFGQEKVNGDIDVEAAIAEENINAPIEKIKKLLEEENISSKATSEHNKIVKSDKFEKDVVGRLKDLQGRVESIQMDKKSEKNKKPIDFLRMGWIV